MALIRIAKLFNYRKTASHPLSFKIAPTGSLILIMATLVRLFGTCVTKQVKFPLCLFAHRNQGHKTYRTCLAYHSSCSEGYQGCTKGKTDQNKSLHHSHSLNFRSCSYNILRQVNERSLYLPRRTVGSCNQALSRNSVVQVRYCSSSSNGSDDSEVGDGIPPDATATVPVEETIASSNSMLAPLGVPDFFPNVPVLAIHRNIVFPGFRKVITVSD